ncbi:MAG: ROK family protein [Dehalococcoidia bacterium]
MTTPRHVAAVDLGGSLVRTAIASEGGDLLARRAEPVDQEAPAEKVVEGILDSLESLLAEVGGRGPPLALGIGVPGLVVPHEGKVIAAVNLPAWQTVSLAELVRRRWPIPVAVENDANMAALGEGWRGVAQGMKTFVFVALGTGVGGGVIVDGQLQRGARGFGGEVCYSCLGREHLEVDYAPAGCLERLVGGPAIARRGSEALGRPVSSEQVFELARQGDAAARGVVRETAEYLAVAFTNMAALLDPEAIVVGGGIARQGELLLAPVRELVHRHVPTKVPILMSALGEDAQLYGAVRSALDLLYSGATKANPAEAER